jgi:hypothetical protein
VDEHGGETETEEAPCEEPQGGLSAGVQGSAHEEPGERLLLLALNGRGERLQTWGSERSLVICHWNGGV